ncbi:MAG: hypothetical protein ABH829_02635 [archaeon]
MRNFLLLAVVLLSLGCLEDVYIGNYVPNTSAYHWPNMSAFDFTIESKKTSCGQVTYDDICIDCKTLESGKTIQCNLDFKWSKKYLWEICTPEAPFPRGSAPHYGQPCAARAFNTTECYLLLEGKLGRRILPC